MYACAAQQLRLLIDGPIDIDQFQSDEIEAGITPEEITFEERCNNGDTDTTNIGERFRWTYVYLNRLQSRWMDSELFQGWLAMHIIANYVVIYCLLSKPMKYIHHAHTCSYIES